MHPTKAYQKVRVSTASPEQLVILLCEGLVRYTAAAADDLDASDWARAGGNFEKAVAILEHLQEALVEEAAPTLVASLDRTYHAWTLCLIRAQLGRDAAKVRALVPQMQGMLESWRSVLSQLMAKAS